MSGRLTLVPTCHVISAGITRSSKMKKVLIVASTLTIVATAIAVPIAVSIATHHHHPAPFRPVFQQPAQTAIKTVPLTKVVAVPVRSVTQLPTTTVVATNGTRITTSVTSNTFTQTFTAFNGNPVIPPVIIFQPPRLINPIIFRFPTTTPPPPVIR